MGMQAPPSINGSQVDLRGLFYSVIDCGGIEKVCDLGINCRSILKTSGLLSLMS
jgi:hypothetical protein